MFPETPRLRLRPFVPEDTEAVFRYRSAPDAMRYIPSGPDKSIEETQKILDRFIKHHDKCRFSKWAVYLRETGEMIGDFFCWRRVRFRARLPACPEVW